MCGITGILSSKLNMDKQVLISKMNSNLVHRGPDGEGSWLEGSIAFGHRRLSILDLSSNGSQPMKSHCERYIISYNGEIYNHFDLRSSIEKELGEFKWRGRSDTETLLEAISIWGIDKALQKSYGMFVFSLWDRRKKILYLARDRIGEKPLYWGWAGQDLIFGSELKALRVHPDFPKEICQKSLSQYLRFMYVPAPRTIYPNIYKLEPGTILSVNELHPLIPSNKPIRPDEKYGNLAIRRYWNINSEIENGSLNQFTDEKEAVFQTKETLTKAVKRQMMSDVPLGTFLSGGIDSSTVAALMQSQSSKKIETFTIGFKETDYDESHHAAKVAKHLNTNHFMLEVTDSEARDLIPNLPWLYDEPFADSSQIPTYFVSRAARKKVTVALSGDGADELFGGYNRYIFGPKIWEKISKIPKPMRAVMGSASRFIPERLWNYLGSVYSKNKVNGLGISNLGSKVHRLSEKLHSVENLQDLYFNIVSTCTDPRLMLKNDFEEPISQLEDSLPSSGIDNSAAYMMLQDMRTYLPDDILCKVDRAAMGVSLETRTPYLDPDVISLSTKLPINMKIRNGQSKWALRQVLYDFLPQKLIDRPKSGFAIPIGLWLRGPLKEWAGELLSSKSIENDGLFDAKVIQKYWSEHLSSSQDRSNLLWTILMFQSWKEYQN